MLEPNRRVVTITENGVTAISPATGFEGIPGCDITVALPIQEEVIKDTITSNGEYTIVPDVMQGYIAMEKGRFAVNVQNTETIYEATATWTKSITSDIYYITNIELPAELMTVIPTEEGQYDYKIRVNVPSEIQQECGILFTSGIVTDTVFIDEGILQIIRNITIEKSIIFNIGYNALYTYTDNTWQFECGSQIYCNDVCEFVVNGDSILTATSIINYSSNIDNMSGSQRFATITCETKRQICFGILTIENNTTQVLDLRNLTSLITYKRTKTADIWGPWILQL